MKLTKKIIEQADIIHKVNKPEDIKLINLSRKIALRNIRMFGFYSYNFNGKKHLIILN